MSPRPILGLPLPQAGDLEKQTSSLCSTLEFTSACKVVSKTVGSCSPWAHSHIRGTRGSGWPASARCLPTKSHQISPDPGKENAAHQQSSCEASDKTHSRPSVQEEVGELLPVNDAACISQNEGSPGPAPGRRVLCHIHGSARPWLLLGHGTRAGGVRAKAEQSS